MKNISVTGIRYRMAIRLWSVVNSQETTLWDALNSFFAAPRARKGRVAGESVAAHDLLLRYRWEASSPAADSSPRAAASRRVSAT